ncbi:MAG: hypothetical protein AAF517_02755, partial [Planctomycetota bacterium]
MKKSGRLAMWGFGVLALGAAAYLFQGNAYEQYYLWMLRSEDAEQRTAAAMGETRWLQIRVMLPVAVYLLAGLLVLG